MARRKARIKAFEKLVRDLFKIIRKKENKDLKSIHTIGKRIVTDPLYCWNKRGNGDLFDDLATAFRLKGLRLKAQTLRQYARFYTKFPDFADFIRRYKVLAQNGILNWTYARTNLLFNKFEVEEPLRSIIFKTIRGKKRRPFLEKTIMKLGLTNHEAEELVAQIKKANLKGARIRRFEQNVDEIAKKVQEEHRLHDYIPHRFTESASTLKREFDDVTFEDLLEYFPRFNHYDENTDDWVIDLPCDINEFVDFIVALGLKEFKKQITNYRRSDECRLRLLAN